MRCDLSSTRALCYLVAVTKTSGGSKLGHLQLHSIQCFTLSITTCRRPSFFAIPLRTPHPLLSIAFYAKRLRVGHIFRWEGEAVGTYVCQVQREQEKKADSGVA